MTKQLRISPQLSLPLDVAGEAIAILAKRGAGKTNTGTVLVEELHKAGVQVVILDPVGAWWGIRSSADGKSEGLPFAILGGEHGDVPLEHTAGAVVADVVVDAGQSLLLDLSDFPSKTAMARFVVDFAERLFRRKARERTLVHLVLEEADTFAPQKGSSDDARMRGAIEQIVRRGRSRGLGITMVTQRSAVLNKDVLSQADVMIAMRTTSPHDVAAIKLWISTHADDELGVIDSLPALETGDGWVWNPERGILDRVRFRRRHTFDSSSTPKAGETRAEPKRVAAIDLAKLGAEIQATAERAKENDPAALRKRIRNLERDIEQERRLASAPPPPDPIIERVEVPVIDPALVEQLGRYLENAIELGDKLEAIGGFLRELGNDTKTALARAEEERGRGRTGTDRGARPAARPLQSVRASAGAQERRHPAPPPRDERERVAPLSGNGSAAGVSGPEQRILDALAALEAIGIAPAHKTQLALFAQASPKSSSYSNNLGGLRTAGLIDYPAGGRVALTDEGRAIADATDAPTSTEELHAFVYQLVGGAKARLLQVLVDAYPHDLGKQTLAEEAGASASSSSFSNNLGSLRSLGLIGYPAPGRVVALPVLFLEQAT